MMLPLDTKFDQQTINAIYEKGHSRVPIYENNVNNIIGVIHVK
jgi:CBS domain containing-hemolysin-like protein